MAIILTANVMTKGLNNMKKITNFVTSLINNYSQYDKLSETYEIDIDDIDSDDLYKLCSLIMQSNPDSAIEATSIDNPAYEASMLPALTYCIGHPRLSFESAWQEGILSYFRKRIIGLLDDALEIYNGEMAA